MNPERFQRVDALFRAALALPVETRAAMLEEQCGDDEDLRREVESLLAEDQATRGPLDTPAFGQPVDIEASMASRAAEGPGAHIGPYRLLEQIGEGGFGLVYMAEQREPVARRVAVKVIKQGMDTKQVIARFEAERQALAMMDHPHIAKVFDAGATDSGRPYFVMELCNGTSITSYCDEHGLSIDDRLDLFLQVCRAVEHAHQKGVIHRDIKPSNVLVATQDGRPFARVIDFGIAKATDTHLTERTMFTEHGQLIGTLEYMSPEQVEGALDIDTRTDVYALGALLYELLTGTTPHARGELRSAAYAEIQRIIREVDPPDPSTRLSQDGAALARIAAARRTDPRRLGTIVRGELDWIVMKAIDKDRGRRYQSASALAADVECHRDGRPVVAAPPSAAYRLHTFVRRNRPLVATTGVLVASLIIGLTLMTIGLVRATRETRRADEAGARADERAAELEQVAAFQASQLSDIDPRAMGDRMRDAIVAALPEERRPATAAGFEEVNFTNVALGALQADILERALDAIDEQFADQPLVRARLLQTVAETAKNLGLLDFATAPQDEALRIREAELGEMHPDTILSMHHLLLLMLQQGRYAEAEPHGRRTMELRRQVIGMDDYTTYSTIGAYGAVLRALHRLDEAYPYYAEALAGYERLLGEDDPDTLVSLNNMGFILRAMQRYEESEAYFRETLERRRRVFGDDHSRTLASVLNMAYVLRTTGKADEAEAYYLEALAGHRRIHGDEHPQTLTSINNTGVFYESQGDYEKAERYYREAMESATRTLGPDHRSTLVYTGALGKTHILQERYDEAEPLLTHALAHSRAVFGREHREPIMHALNLSRLYAAREETQLALALIDEILEPAHRLLGDEARETVALEQLRAELTGETAD